MSRNHIHRTVTLHAIKVHCKVLFISKQRLGNFVELFENFKFLCLSVEFRNFSPLYFSFPDISFYFNVYVGGIAHGLIVKKLEKQTSASFNFLIRDMSVHDSEGDDRYANFLFHHRGERGHPFIYQQC